jgi:RNA polymerase sigma-70 factor (ECF subfamily)
MSIDQDLCIATALPSPDVGSMTDEELLIEYRETCDQRAFSELVRRHQRGLRAYLHRRFKNETVAEDAVQTTFLRAHLNCRQFREGRRVRSWLYAIATNAAIDIVRRRSRREAVSLNGPPTYSATDATAMLDTLPDDEPLPNERLMRGERHAECREAVTQLPERLRVVVELLYFRGVSYREAAEILSVPLGTLKSRLHDALIKLRVIWGRRREALSVT